MQKSIYDYSLRMARNRFKLTARLSKLEKLQLIYQRLNCGRNISASRHLDRKERKPISPTDHSPIFLVPEIHHVTAKLYNTQSILTELVSHFFWSFRIRLLINHFYVLVNRRTSDFEHQKWSKRLVGIFTVLVSLVSFPCIPVTLLWRIFMRTGLLSHHPTICHN